MRYIKTWYDLKTNCKYVACGGWETGSSLEVTEKSDSSHNHQPENMDTVKFLHLLCIEKVKYNEISEKCKKWKHNGMMDQKAKSNANDHVK
jgi:hypothetical protein